MPNIFSIQSEYRQLAATIIDNDGEATDEQIEALQITEKQLYVKSENYCWLVKETQGEVDFITSEIERLSKAKKVRENLIDRLKDTVLQAMQMVELKEIKTPVMKISIRESEAVEIVNEAQLSDIFMKEKVTKTPDKIMLKEALKQGQNVEGAILQKNYSLQIK